MTRALRYLGLAALCALWAASAAAQTPSATTTTSAQVGHAASPRTTPEETRPATATFFGDTGLWFVPTAEVLAANTFSGSGYRSETGTTRGITTS